MPGNPPVKIKRMAFDVNRSENNHCHCANCIERLEKNIEDLKNTMHQANNIIRDQLKIAIDSLAEQKVVLNQLLRGRSEELSLETKFPLKDEEDLFKINCDINEHNRNVYIKTMRSLLQPAGVIKNLKHIISDIIIKDYNVDGIQGKKSLKSLQNFYKAFLAITLLILYIKQEFLRIFISDCISGSNGEGTADNQLRRAIQLQKNEFLKTYVQQKLNVPATLKAFSHHTNRTI